VSKAADNPRGCAAAMRDGYCIVSRRHRIAARIDRPDWREALAKLYGDYEAGAKWVRTLGDTDAADHYRRVMSKDQIIVPPAWIKILPNSGQGPADFQREVLCE
jgi:hypothetical protein